MRSARPLAVALALAAPFLLLACNDSCPTEATRVNSVPACVLAAGATVTVTLPLCARCNQTVPSCQVVPPAGDRSFQLDTTAQACTDPGGCDFSCANPLPTVSCTFRAPALSGDNTWDFVVIDPDGAFQTHQFTVATTGDTTCGG